MAILAGDPDSRHLLSDHVATTGNLVSLGGVAAHTLETGRQVDICPHGGIVTMLEVGTTRRTEVAARAHLARRLLGVPGRCHHVHSRRGGQMEVTLCILCHRSAVGRTVGVCSA